MNPKPDLHFALHPPLRITPAQWCAFADGRWICEAATFEECRDAAYATLGDQAPDHYWLNDGRKVRKVAA